jgi:hypothetical protein
MNWMDRAACKSLPTDVFFEPEREDFDNFNDFVDARAQSYRAAKAVCETCPVQRKCLYENILQRHGVWGGKTPSQRQSLAKKLKIGPGKGSGNRPSEERGITDHTLEVVLMYFDKGHTYKDIEALTGVGKGVVYRLIKHYRDSERQERVEERENEIQERRAKGAFAIRANMSWDDDKYAEARKLLIDGGMQKKEIIEITGIPKTTLYRLELGMRQAGVLQ